MPHYREMHIGGTTGVYCEDCGVLVWNTVAHDRHHADLEEARRKAQRAYPRS